MLLQHSLNGLKQGSHDWHEKADQALRDQSFQPTIVDPCLYFRWKKDKLTLIGLYVDDFCVAADCEADLAEVARGFDQAKIEIQSPDPVLWLGMHLHHDREAGTLQIKQTKYIDELLKETNMLDCKPAYTPVAPGSKLRKTCSQLQSQ